MINALAILADSPGFEHMDGWGGGWMWLWGFAMMSLVVVAVVGLLRAAAGSSSSPRSSSLDDARQILAERYARGELSTEEYRERVDEFS